jgi:hypothetical protein
MTGAAVAQPFLQTSENATPDPELIPLLEKYFHSGCSDHEWALKPLAKWLPEERTEALLKDALDSNDTAAQFFILDYGCYGGVQERVWSRVLLHGVMHMDAAVRLKAWGSFWLNSNVSRAVQIECVERLLKILDGNDPSQRRGAAQRIVRGLWIRELAALDEKPWFQKIRLPNTPPHPTRPSVRWRAGPPAECAALDDVPLPRENGSQTGGEVVMKQRRRQSNRRRAGCTAAGALWDCSPARWIGVVVALRIANGLKLPGCFPPMASQWRSAVCPSCGRSLAARAAAG